MRLKYVTNFLDAIKEGSTRVWVFTLSDGRTISGRVIDYRMDGHGTPITIKIFEFGTTDAPEIPWVSILTIK